MIKNYENALKIMRGHDEKMNQTINSFFPESIIGKNNGSGETFADDKVWTFEDSGEHMWVSVATNDENSKAIADINLQSLSESKLKLLGKSRNNKLIGYINIHSYGESESIPTHTINTYVFYAKSQENGKLAITVTSSKMESVDQEIGTIKNTTMIGDDREICRKTSFIDISELIPKKR